jgi:hypothetical protein
VVELTRACFGKAQWGAMWKLVQVRELPGECHIEPEPEPEAEPEPVADAAAEPAEDDLADDVDEYA